MGINSAKHSINISLTQGKNSKVKRTVCIHKMSMGLQRARQIQMQCECLTVKNCLKYVIDVFTQPCGTQAPGNSIYATITRQKVNWDERKSKIKILPVCCVYLFLPFL